MIIQIRNMEDLDLLYQYAIKHKFNDYGPYYSNYKSREHLFPIYLEIDDATLKFIGWQNEVYKVGGRYLDKFNSGISVTDLLDIKQEYEYW